jgi:predicted ATPase
LKAVGEALDFVQGTGETFFEAELFRLNGELLLQKNPAAVTEAEHCFSEALAVARKQLACSLELRAAISLAQLWCRQGKRRAACELVQGVYAGFTEGFRTHDLQTAAAFLGAPEKPPGIS